MFQRIFSSFAVVVVLFIAACGGGEKIGSVSFDNDVVSDSDGSPAFVENDSLVPDVGVDEVDVRHNVPDVDEVDVGTDTTEADASEDTDAEILPDVSSDTEVDAEADVVEDTAEVDAEADVVVEEDVIIEDDVATPDVAQQATLSFDWVEGPNMEPRLIDASVEQDVTIDTLRLCAEGGDVNLSQLTLRFFGDFGTNDMKVSYRGQSTVLHNISGYTNASVLFSQGFEIVSGTCEDFVVEVRLTSLSGRFRWIRTAFVDTGVTDSVAIVYPASFNSRVVISEVRARAHLVAHNASPTQTLFFGNDSQDQVMAHFGLSSYVTEHVFVRSARFRVETLGNHDDVPGWLAANRNRSANLDHVYQNNEFALGNGAVFEWVPENGPMELGWGSSVEFRFFFSSVPAGLEQIQIFLESVELEEGEVLISELVDNYWRDVPFGGNLPWNIIQFVEASLDGFVSPPRVDWFGLSQPDRAVNYVDPALMGCVPSTPNGCYLLRLGAQLGVGGVSLSSLRMSFVSTNMEAFDVVVAVRPSQDESLVRSYAFQIQPGENTLEIPEEISLVYGFGWSQLDVRVYPVANSDLQLLATAGMWAEPELAITVEELKFRRGSVEADAVVYAPNVPSNAPFANQPFPYTGARMVFHEAEIWLNNNYSGGPIRGVSMANYGGEALDLFQADFVNPYGGVVLRKLRFLHNSGKVAPPFGEITVRINSNIFVLVDWNRNEAIFEIAGNSAWFNADSEFVVAVEGHNPTEATEFLQFELVEMQAVPENREEPLVPIILDEDGEGNRTLLNEADSIPGRRWFIGE